MDLKSDKQQHIQTELDFTSALVGEAAERGGERLNRHWRPMIPNAQLIQID